MKTAVSLAQADPQNALARRDLAYARERLSKVLAANPTNAEGQASLAKAYFKLGQAALELAANKNRERLQEARSLYQKSLAI